MKNSHLTFVRSRVIAAFCVLFTWLATNPIHAQTLQESWSTTYAGAFGGSDGAVEVVCDSSGNVIVIGFVSVGANYWETNLYLAKYDGNTGAKIWEQIISKTGIFRLFPQNLSVDASDNVIFTAELKPTQNTSHMYVAKHAAATGQMLWENSMSSHTNSRIDSPQLLIDTESNVIVSVNLPKGEIVGDCLVSKLDAGTGASLWSIKQEGQVSVFPNVGPIFQSGVQIIDIKIDPWNDVILCDTEYARSTSYRLQSSIGFVVDTESTNRSWKISKLSSVDGSLEWNQSSERVNCLTVNEEGTSFLGTDSGKIYKRSSSGDLIATYEYDHGFARDMEHTPNGDLYVLGDNSLLKLSSQGDSVAWNASLGGSFQFPLNFDESGNIFVISTLRVRKLNVNDGGMIFELDALSTDASFAKFDVLPNGFPVFAGSKLGDIRTTAFELPGPPISNLSSLSNGNTRQILSAHINPKGSSTSGVFEYRQLGDEDYTATAAIDVGSGTLPVLKSKLISGLLPNTEYEWRAVFTNIDGTITINGPNFTKENSAPIAVNDGPEESYTFLNTTAPTLSVLGNDTDVDEDTLTITVVTQGAHGVVSIVGDGSAVSYDPEDTYVGADTFTYTISDGHGGSATGTVSVLVTDSTYPVITAVPVDRVINLVEGSSVALVDLTVELEATDDVEVTSKTQSPVAGTLLGLGSHTISFTVSDATGHEVTAACMVTVVADYPVSNLDAGSGEAVLEGSETRYLSFGVAGLDGEIPVFKSLVQTGTGPKLKAVTVSTPDGQETFAVLDAAPDLEGYVFSSFKDPIGNGGSAFVASVKPLLNPASKVDDHGLWTNALNDAFGDWKLVARKGQASPVAGLNYKLIKDIVLNDGGHLLWTAQLAGVSVASDDVLCVQSTVVDGAKVLLREGQSIDGRIVKSFLALQAPAKGSGDGRTNGGANTCVLVTFVGGAKGIVMVGEDITAELVAVTGSLGLTDVESKWGALFLPAMSGDEAVVFRAKLKVGMGGVTRTTAEGIFTNVGGAGVTTLVRAGEGVEGISGATFVSFGDPTSDASGNVMFLAKIKAGAVLSEALFYIASGEINPELVVQSRQAIGDSGFKIKTFTSVALPRGEDDSSGGAIFTAVLVPVTGAAKQTTALCAVDSEGEVQILAQTGDTVEVNGTDKTLQQISALSYVLGSPSAARSAGDVSQVIYRATFTDKTQAIIRVVVP